MGYEDIMPRYAKRRADVFDPKLVNYNDSGEAFIRPRGWVELEIRWMRAGMGASHARCLGLLLWKAGNELDYRASRSAVARTLGYSRSWVVEITGTFREIGMLTVVRQVPNRGLVFRWLTYEHALRAIHAHRTIWKRCHRQPGGAAP